MSSLQDHSRKLGEKKSKFQAKIVLFLAKFVFQKSHSVLEKKSYKYVCLDRGPNWKQNLVYMVYIKYNNLTYKQKYDFQHFTF